MARSTAAGGQAASSKKPITVQEATGEDAIRIERLGEVWIIVPSSAIENLQWELIEEASNLLVSPISRLKVPQVIIDLSEVDYFGSVFLSLLLRLERCVRKQGGTMVLAGPSERARELLRVTNLDTIWAIYESRQEALQAIA